MSYFRGAYEYFKNRFGGSGSGSGGGIGCQGPNSVTVIEPPEFPNPKHHQKFGTSGTSGTRTSGLQNGILGASGASGPNFRGFSVGTPSSLILGLFGGHRKRKWDKMSGASGASGSSGAGAGAPGSSDPLETYRRMVDAITRTDNSIVKSSFFGSSGAGAGAEEVGLGQTNTKRHRQAGAGPLAPTLTTIRQEHLDVMNIWRNWQSTGATNGGGSSSSKVRHVHVNESQTKRNERWGRSSKIDFGANGTSGTGAEGRQVPIYSSASSSSRRNRKPEVITLGSEAEEEPEPEPEIEILESPAPAPDPEIEILKTIPAPAAPSSSKNASGTSSFFPAPAPINSFELETRSASFRSKNWLISTQKTYHEAQERKRAEIELESKKLQLLQKSTFARRPKDLEERIRNNLKISDVIILDEEEPEVTARLPEVTQEMKDFILSKMRGRSNEVTATLTKNDLRTLGPCQWLNDMVINSYMELIVARAKAKTENYPSTYAFTTFFYPKYLHEGHSNILKRWTRRVDIFSYELILFPIHLGVHWALATADIPKRTIKYYDSLLGKQTRCLESLFNYLASEYKERHKEAPPLDRSQWTLQLVQDIPCQENGSDCGVFTCQFAEYLSRRAKISFAQPNMPYFRERMSWELLTQQLLT